jgi:CHAT domain-containing protein
VLNSDLVLSGEVTENGTVADDLLACSTVKRRALFHARGADPSGLVFVNACQTGRAGEGISGVSGFADAFLRPTTEGGAAVFVGALWSVGDTLARTFADTFYARLLAGERLVDAVKAARRTCQDESDFTWLAYTVYGNPFARVE